jgi:hypothetical protein
LTASNSGEATISNPADVTNNTPSSCSYVGGCSLTVTGPGLSSSL